MSLRSKTIRLAYANDVLQPYLLPLLRQGAYWNRSDFWRDLVSVDQDSPRHKIDKTEARIKKRFLSLPLHVFDFEIDILADQITFKVEGGSIWSRLGISSTLDDDTLLEMIESPEHEDAFDSLIHSGLAPYMNMTKDTKGWGARIRNGDVLLVMNLASK